MTFEPIPRIDAGTKKGKQIGGWITRCASCGDMITVRHRRPTFCMDCQAKKCGADPKTFSRFYRSSQWRRLRKIIFETKGRVCVYCQGFASHVDHKQPFSFGGTNEPANLQPVCASCNSKKQGMSERDFLETYPQLKTKRG